jgi:hypothetical protein
MAKTDNTSTSTNRNQLNVSLNVSGKASNGAPVIAIDIAQDGVSFTRVSTSTDLDAASDTATALSLSSGKPTRVTMNGGVYAVYTRNGG